MRGLDERAEIGAFVLAAEQRHGARLGKRFERLERGIDVRGLRIVVAAHARDDAARLDAVLERRERAQMRGHGARIDAERKSCGGCGQRVRDVVASLDLQFVGTDHGVLHPSERHAQHAVAVDERGGVAAARGAHVAAKARRRAHRHVREAALMRVERAQAAHLVAHDVVGRVEHRHGPRHVRQVREQPELRVAVRLEAAMPAQMVGRDVEQDGHVRREEPRGSQLVRRHLGHVHLCAARAHRLDARIPDIAHGRGGQPCARKHVRGKRADRRLAVGARHRHPAALFRALAPGELHLAHHLGRHGRGGLVERRELRDAGTGHAQIERAARLGGQNARGVVLERDERAGCARRVRERLGRLGARARRDGQSLHAPAQKRQKVRHGGAPALSQAQNEHAPQMARRVLPPLDESALLHVTPPPSASRQSRSRSPSRPARRRRSRSARPPSSRSIPSSRNDGAKAP